MKKIRFFDSKNWKKEVKLFTKKAIYTRKNMFFIFRLVSKNQGKCSHMRRFCEVELRRPSNSISFSKSKTCWKQPLPSGKQNMCFPKFIWGIKKLLEIFFLTKADTFKVTTTSGKAKSRAFSFSKIRFLD